MSRIKNVSVMVWEKAFKLVISLFWIAYLSRFLGPEEFGVYSYIFAIITMVSTFPIFGMENIVIKSLVNGKDNVIKSAFIIRTSFSIIGTGIVFIACSLANIEDVYITISFTLAIFISLNVDLIKNYYQSREESRKYVYLDNISILLSLFTKIFLIDMDYINYPLLISLDYIYSLVFIGVFFLSGSKKLNLTRVSISEIIDVINKSFPFFISTVMVVIYSRIDQLMIKEFLGYEELGYYSAALRISSSWWVIPTTIALSLYPSLIKKYSESKNDINVIYYFSICAYTTLFISGLIFALSDILVYFVYGEQYSLAADIIKLHCFMGCLATLGVARSKWLIIKNLQNWLPLFVFSGMLINIIGNYLMIPPYGVKGAVYATFLSQISVLIVVPFFIPKVRRTVMLLILGFLPVNAIYAWKTYFK